MAQTALTVLGNAIGLLVSSWILSGFNLSGFAFFVSVGFFTATQVLLAPFMTSVAIKYLPAVRGGIALVAAFVSLLLTTWITSGLEVNGIVAWVVAPLIIWVCTVLAGVLLPLVLFKKVLPNKRSSKSE